MQADSGIWPAVLLGGSLYYSLFGGWLDSILLLIFSAWRNRAALLGHVDFEIVKSILLALPGIAVGFVCFQIVRYLVTQVDGPRWTGPGKPLLIPCTTTHRRMFPKQNAFTYSYLVVGIPVGWAGSAGGMVSTEIPKDPRAFALLSLAPVRRKGWFDVDPSDYLERGNGHLGLRGKLDAYLEAQGADPAAYPHAYLITAARFLGYHFNPVSFWYLYSEKKELTAMILEVNNTFGERRMYFLKHGSFPSDLQLSDQDVGDRKDSAVDSPPDSQVAAQQTPSKGGGPATRLRQSWPKDFHVSPFNSRKGSYSLLANDPFGPGMEGLCHIDNTVNLKSSKDHPKLVARLFSAGPAIDPLAMTVLQKLKFLLGWWWVGFVTFPRIVKEAGRLFFRRKLHVWYRPEPLKESMGRIADETERQLEPIFRKYLRHIVEQSTASVKVKYVPGGMDTTNTETMVSPLATKNPKRAEELEFRVLTPAFYTRFVQYAHDFEAIFCEFRESSTIWISKPDLLPKIILKKPTPTLRTTSGLDYGYFKAIQRLRRRPERIVRPLTSDAAPPQAPETQKFDIRDFRISSMDGFVLTNETSQTRKRYRSLVLRIFLANRFALGSIELLQLQHFVLRTGVAWALSYSVDAVLLGVP